MQVRRWRVLDRLVLSSGLVPLLIREELTQMAIDHEARLQGVQRGVGLNLGGVEVELLAPDQARLLTKLDYMLEEPAEDRQAEALTDAGQAGVVRERLIEVVAEVPAMRQVEAGQLNELALGADALEEHDEVEPEEDDGIDGGTATWCVAVFDPLSDAGQVKVGIQGPVEVTSRDELLQADGHGTIEAAELRGTEHGGGLLGQDRMTTLYPPGPSPGGVAGWSAHLYEMRSRGAQRQGHVTGRALSPDVVLLGHAPLPCALEQLLQLPPMLLNGPASRSCQADLGIGHLADKALLDPD